MDNTAAVLVQNAYKSYGKKEILKKLSLRVPKGCIYGLLGASGCGKTTLLSCVVGRKNFDAGEVSVLGGKPGTVGSGIPGPKVGYMPQEIALVGEFTVKDAIFYFGRIFHMDEKNIKERFYQLTDLLNLPDENRFIKNCSGGQQRRVSFAAAMVHLPELLILDEPTAGVDPVLREKIWDYLVKITTEHGISVIITTHYIEETKQANFIGLLREGCLLAEDPPSKLLNKFQTNSLEEVFLILSQKQNEGRLETVDSVQNIKSSTTTLNSMYTTHGSTDVLTNDKTKPKKLKKVNGYKINNKRMKALLDKNFKQFYRNLTGILFVFLFPIAQNLCFLFAVGPDIHDVKLGIINDETLTTSCSDYLINQTAIPHSINSCHFHNLSCRFLDYLDIPMINKVKYQSLPVAIDAVKHGDVVGALHMAQNFSLSLEERIRLGRSVTEDVINFSEIKVWMDMSSSQLGFTIKNKLISRFIDFEKDLLKDCHLDSKLAELAIVKTIYGETTDEFTEYVTPGLVMTFMFFMMTIMTSQIIITDRFEGVWDRSIIAGVTSVEIILAHFTVQILIVFAYTIQIMIITFLIFGVKVLGELWIIALLTFLQGVNGAGYGFFISIISYDVNMANILATGTFYVTIFISGIVWPLEAMPMFLQWISKCLPFTIPIVSFRNVMKKAWGIGDIQVYNGIAIEATWILLFSVINAVLIRRKR